MLCGSRGSRSSWLDGIFYGGQEFSYLQCLDCRSLFCQPMPDDRMLARMYGLEYGRAFAADPAVSDPKEPARVLEWLRSAGPGTFVDYGCGNGRLMVEAGKLGWRPIGVEFDEDVAAASSQRESIRIVSRSQIDSIPPGCADVLHLGDVIEHLTDLERQMPVILGLIKPGGTLLAQGPLEANRNFFTWVVRLTRSIRPARRTEMAPYHVLLATATGQRRFFERLGLEELTYTVHEVDWPAPSRLAWDDWRRPRTLGLFLARRASKSITAMRGGRCGNRYFYAGRWPG
jgi:SAM-dependent methyltransferase